MSDQPNENKALVEKKPSQHKLEFVLVVVMLGVLTLLLGIMIFLPILAGGKSSPDGKNEIIEYSKWIVTALLAAFGAWIGAGAAYFFGKANLVESSRSTERALEIVRGSRGLKYIKDLMLTAMNMNFLFNLNQKAEEVAQKLDKNTGYWFVPVIDENDGVLKDIIHAQVFWSKAFATKTIQEAIAEMDQDPNLKKLHGNEFFLKVSLNDTIQEVHDLMTGKNNPVAIVVDDKGKPTHCLTRTDLNNVMKTKEND